MKILHRTSKFHLIWPQQSHNSKRILKKHVKINTLSVLAWKVQEFLFSPQSSIQLLHSPLCFQRFLLKRNLLEKFVCNHFIFINQNFCTAASQFSFATEQFQKNIFRNPLTKSSKISPNFINNFSSSSQWVFYSFPLISTTFSCHSAL